MGSNARRLQKELADLRANISSSVRVVNVDDNNISRWTLLIVPNTEPYNKGAFRVVIDFPSEYPFKPPTIKFETKIHHPNVDESGQVCLALINTENWKPATRTQQVMEALLNLISEPDFSSPLRGNLAEEYQKDKAKFFRTAEEFTRTHAEKRP